MTIKTIHENRATLRELRDLALELSISNSDVKTRVENNPRTQLGNRRFSRLPHYLMSGN